MLHTIRLKNFRSFQDTRDVELRRLNVLLGPNNAGKSSFLSTVELFFKSSNYATPLGPLAFEAMPSFASFDSTLRRHWSRSEQRPTEFLLSYMAGTDARRVSYAFTCKGRPNDNTSYVAQAVYRFADAELVVVPRPGSSPRRPKYNVTLNKKNYEDAQLFFHGLLPFGSNMPGLEQFLPHEPDFPRLEVVHPYRPIPRSFYVLDDPNLSPQDRELLTYLIRLWSSDESSAMKVRERISENLHSLGLSNYFNVKQVTKRVGPKVFEILVAPTIPRHRVTIADAGFGLSQALPLAAYDARLSNGYFIAYQPEVHLHPFAQSRLADIFTQSVSRGNQLFIETHSTDLILRLQTKVTTGELPSDALRVLCFENRKGKTRITPVEFTGQGTPQIPWPSGFLDTSLQLARELATERSKVRKHAS